MSNSVASEKTDALLVRLCDVCGEIAKTHVKGKKQTHYVCRRHFKKFMDLKDKSRLP